MRCHVWPLVAQAVLAVRQSWGLSQAEAEHAANQLEPEVL